MGTSSGYNLRNGRKWLLLPTDFESPLRCVDGKSFESRWPGIQDAFKKAPCQWQLKRGSNTSVEK
jgi:hypothetical protein